MKEKEDLKRRSDRETEKRLEKVKEQSFFFK